MFALRITYQSGESWRNYTNPVLTGKSHSAPWDLIKYVWPLGQVGGWDNEYKEFHNHNVPWPVSVIHLTEIVYIIKFCIVMYCTKADTFPYRLSHQG